MQTFNNPLFLYINISMSLINITSTPFSIRSTHTKISLLNCPRFTSSNSLLLQLCLCDFMFTLLHFPFVFLLFKLHFLFLFSQFSFFCQLMMFLGSLLEHPALFCNMIESRLLLVYQRFRLCSLCFQTFSLEFVLSFNLFYLQSY